MNASLVSSRVLGAKVKVLFLSANPSDTSRLAVGAEFRAIDESVNRSKNRARIELVAALEVRSLELGKALQHHEPDVVHFSGHGSADGELLLADADGRAAPAQPEAVARLFGSLSRDIPVRCVVLNACYTEALAKALVEHVDCVIGTPVALRDTVAITFADSFYLSLGNGLDVQAAYDFACAQVALDQSGSAACPKLHCRAGVDARSVRVVAPSKPVAQVAPPRREPAVEAPSPMRFVALAAVLFALAVLAVAWRVNTAPVPALGASVDAAAPPDARAASPVVVSQPDAPIAPPREPVSAHDRPPERRDRAPSPTIDRPQVPPPEPPRAAPPRPCAFDDPTCNDVTR